MKLGSADLHLHTTASDGAWTPSELVDRARDVGLEIMAVTDHDTLDGLDEAIDRGNRHGIEVVPGVELSARDGGQEVHLLGYFIDRANPELRSALLACQDERIGRIERIVERLGELNYDVTAEEVLRVAQHGSAGRPHIARVLVDKGYVPSVPVAFDRLLAEGRPAYVPRLRLTPADAIGLVHRAGGVAVCAHPALLQNDAIIAELVACGLDGIEVIHSEHDAQAVDRYQALAQEYDLLMSGGSDCHGPGVKKCLYIGDYTVPTDWVQALRQRAHARTRGWATSHVPTKG